MWIETKAIEQLKRNVDLKSLVERSGVALKKRGRNWAGICPFHEGDTDPSFVVNPKTNLYKCFGCPPKDSGGDAITFLMKREGLTFQKAFARLTELAGALPPPPVNTTKPADEKAAAQRIELLGRVAEYYRQRFKVDARARDYLAERGITDQKALEAFGAGYCDGSLKGALVTDGDVFTDLRELGVLNDQGELLNECVVFPLWDRDHRCVGMYGRRLYDSEVNHLYLPGPRRGLVNSHAAAQGAEVILCEAVIDALSLYVAGLTAVLPCYGTQGFTEDHAAFLNRGQRVVICFDADAAGRRAAKDLEARLRADHEVRVVELPEASDVNELLVSRGPAALRSLVLGEPGPETPAPRRPAAAVARAGAAEFAAQAQPAPPESEPLPPRPAQGGTPQSEPPQPGPAQLPTPQPESDEPGPAQLATPQPESLQPGPTQAETPQSASPQVGAPAGVAPQPGPAQPAPPQQPPAGDAAPVVEQTKAGLLMRAGGVAYEVCGIARQSTQLKVLLKVSRDDGRSDTSSLDLYSWRSREFMANAFARSLDLGEEQLSAALKALIAPVEKAAAAEAGSSDSKKDTVELTDTEREEAQRMLARPDLIDQVLRDFEQVGYAGEVINVQLGTLVTTSRKLKKPLSLLIEARSSAGKSALQDAILGFVPQEHFRKYSRLTDQSLFYMDPDALQGMVLVIEEAAGMGGAVFAVRALSNGELRVATATRDPVTGRMRTDEYTVKTHTSVMMTNTDPNFNEETKSRFILTTIDESLEATRRILEVQRWAHTPEGMALAQRAERVRGKHQNAQRLLAAMPVGIPARYCTRLSFPASSLLARRDQLKYMGLIEASALLHQRRRERFKRVLYGETVDCILAQLEDIAIANRIARQVLVRPNPDISPQGVRLFKLVREMIIAKGSRSNGSAAKGEVAFNRRALREYTQWNDWQVRTHLNELVELEYLRLRQGKNGKEYLYELADTHLLEALPGFGLTDVDELRHVLGAGDNEVDADADAGGAADPIIREAILEAADGGAAGEATEECQPCEKNGDLEEKGVNLVRP